MGCQCNWGGAKCEPTHLCRHINTGHITKFPKIGTSCPCLLPLVSATSSGDFDLKSNKV